MTVIFTGPYFVYFAIYLKCVKIKQSDICIQWKSKRVLLVFMHYRVSRKTFRGILRDFRTEKNVREAR